MSFSRLVYYSAVIGGWSAFVGWLLSEILFHGGTSGRLPLAAIGALVGAAIGSGLNLVAGSTNLHWKQLVLRLIPGIIVGGIGGMIGILVGDVLYTTLRLPRALGWLMMGLGIGLVEGITEQSSQKLRNGLIGGGLGGLLGGILFDPLANMIHSGTGMTSRAAAFVILGVCIGILIGLAQVILKEAWLSVIDGYRPGRQLVISKTVTFLGRGDHLQLPFMGPANQSLEREHIKITRQPDGTFVAEDNQSKQGSLLNSKPLQTPTVLADGDVLKLGTNFVRFNWKKSGRSTAASPAAVQTSAPVMARPVVPPPPPPPPSTRPRSGAAQPTSPVVASAAEPVVIQPVATPTPPVAPNRPASAVPTPQPPPMPTKPAVPQSDSSSSKKIPPPPPPPKKR